MKWEMNRFGHLLVTSTDGTRDLYIQRDYDVESFLQDAGHEDAGPGDQDDCPEWMESEYWDVLRPIEKREEKPINWAFVPWVGPAQYFNPRTGRWE